MKIGLAILYIKLKVSNCSIKKENIKNLLEKQSEQYKNTPILFYQKTLKLITSGGD